MAGIKEVAAEAGVSTATVSRALRGMHHVNEETRQKIVAAALKLNYPLMKEKAVRPDGRTKSVGIVSPYIASWYYAQVINGAEEVLRELTPRRATACTVSSVRHFKRQYRLRCRVNRQY